MLVNIFKWFCGYIYFKVFNGFPEKFINEANKEKVNLWDLKKINGELYAKIFISDYDKIEKYSKKSDSQIKILKNYGLPVFLNKYNKRIGAISGILIFLIIIKIFSLYIWNINIFGNKDIAAESIISSMNDLGIKPATLKSNINSSMVKYLLMAKHPDISWISVNIKGSNLNVFIKEKIKSPEIIKEGTFCNIVAETEGQIDHMEVYKGNPCVNEGDAVVKGQMLISGSKIDDLGNACQIESNGKVFAKTKRIIKEKVKLRELLASDSGKILKKYKVNLFGKEFSLNPWKKIDDEYRTETQVNQISFFGNDLPIIFFTDVCYHQKEEEKFLSQEEAKNLLEKIINEKEKNEMNNIKILSKNVSNYEEDNEYVAQVDYTCIENIAKKQEIF